MSAVDDYFPYSIEEYKGKIEEKASELQGILPQDLIMKALKLIMEEQQRRGGTAPGWPSDDHAAMRFFLHEATK